ncbi:MAG: hypothetical protein MZV64_48675 [Ignavibacteriales bacterium]|nr:hypothetical protein [Ignavibacteriales bacterium]
MRRARRTRPGRAAGGAPQSTLKRELVWEPGPRAPDTRARRAGRALARPDGARSRRSPAGAAAAHTRPARA